jgi:hypothetical protein
LEVFIFLDIFFISHPGDPNGKKVNLSLLQAMEAHSVARHQASQMAVRLSALRTGHPLPPRFLAPDMSLAQKKRWSLAWEMGRNEFGLCYLLGHRTGEYLLFSILLFNTKPAS